MSQTIAADSILTLHYENERPIELVDLTTSLQAVSRRYARFAAQSELRLDDDATKLYVREIRKGSIIVDLVNMVSAHPYATVGSGLTVIGGGTAAVTQTNAVVTFAKNLRDGLNWLRGTGKKPDELPAAELRDLAKIVEPIAKDPHGSLNIQAAEGASVVVSINYNSLEANAIQNRAEKEIEARSEPIQKTFRQVLMYWHQASRGASSRSDKAIIDSISDRPLKVVFEDGDEEIKSRMIRGQDNPFTMGFMVDVELMTIRGKPAAYKVKHLYEVLDDEDRDDPIQDLDPA